MDKATVIGQVGALLIVAWAISTSGTPFSAFWDRPSVMLVVGGTIAAMLTAFPMSVLVRVPAIVRKAFRPSVPRIDPVIRQLVRFSELARRDGILALEARLHEVQDPFLRLGLEMAIDGTDPALMESILRTEMETLAARHKTGKAVFETLNRFAPAWGMIGTLVGLIIMLGNMDDPNSIGPGMAVALLTTFYGATISNMICGPIAEKLAYFSRCELEVREIALRGILSIQVGDNPRILEQKLRIFQVPTERATPRARAAA